jgi:predicted amino acid racemase
MNKTILEKSKEEKVLELMCAVLELSEQTEQRVIKIIKTVGLASFFNGFETMKFTEEEKERIRALKHVIEAKAKSIEVMEGGK